MKPESTQVLVIANAIALALGLLLKWPIDVMLWPYWIQSAVIGFFAYRRLTALDKVFAAQQNPEPPDEWDSDTRVTGARSRISPAAFFAIFYGAWFLMFLGALFQNHVANIDSWDVVGIAVAGFAFTYNHWYSYRENSAADVAGNPTLPTAFFAPFLRAAPMFIGFYAAQELAGRTTAWLVIGFCAAKTLVDIAMHRNERRMLRAQQSKTRAGRAP
jgi:hypothetical protein